MQELNNLIELYKQRIEYCEEAYVKLRRDEDFYALLTYKRVVDELKVLSKSLSRKEKNNYEM